MSIYAAPLTDPDGLNVMIVDPSADSKPVTAMFSWTALNNVTADGQNIIYTIMVVNEDDTIVANASISHPNATLEISDLPACANLTATLTAERGSESSNGTPLDFSTLEPNGEYDITIHEVERNAIYSIPFYIIMFAEPVDIGVYSMMPDYPAGSDITLLCMWTTSVYYVAWYKDGVLLYEEDLAAPSVLMAPRQGITVDSDFTLMTSTLTIGNARLEDSGNYTCAVTCGARGAEFGMIAANLQDTTEVFVYGKY